MVNFDLHTINDLEKRWANKQAEICSIHDMETTNWFIWLVHYVGYVQFAVIVLITGLIGYKLYRCYNPKTILPSAIGSGVNILMGTAQPSPSPRAIVRRRSPSITSTMDPLVELQDVSQQLSLTAIDEENETSSSVSTSPTPHDFKPKSPKSVSFKRNQSGRFFHQIAVPATLSYSTTLHSS
jgi:hypothetical protein